MRRTAVLLASLPWCAIAFAQQAVVPGSGNDYQASVAVPWQQSQQRVLVFERLDVSFNGDLWLIRSDDGGSSWGAPAPVVATSGNERHPALVQTGEKSWSLFHLSNASGGYRIHRATSADGETFSSSLPIDLGWATSGEINPYVIRQPDGSLLLTYHRLNGAAYLATSRDNGATWDNLRTQISPQAAALPRIARRESDGRYLLVYQTGSNPVSLWVKTSHDPYDWSAPARRLITDGNNHDAFPVLLPDGSFVVFWARVANGGFQVFSTRSQDGVDWQPFIQHTDRAGLANIQPYALPGPGPDTAELYWGAAQVPGDSDYDIVREARVLVADFLFADSFEMP